MAECEICGRPLLREREARIDGIVFMVCDNCVTLGHEMPVTAPVQRKGIDEHVVDDDYVLSPNFGEKIKLEREKRGMTQAQLASKLGQKESVIKRIEHNIGSDEGTMKKFERFLSIRLYEKPQSGDLKEREDSPGLTLGDVAEIKKGKRTSE